MKRALPISGQLKFVGLMQMIRNRHLAEWRFPLFTQIVMVKLPIWNVSVIGMTLTPFRRCSQPPIRLLQCSFRPHYGDGFILSGNEKNVKPLSERFEKTRLLPICFTPLKTCVYRKAHGNRHLAQVAVSAFYTDRHPSAPFDSPCPNLVMRVGFYCESFAFTVNLIQMPAARPLRGNRR